MVRSTGIAFALTAVLSLGGVGAWAEDCSLAEIAEATQPHRDLEATSPWVSGEVPDGYEDLRVACSMINTTCVDAWEALDDHASLLPDNSEFWALLDAALTAITPTCQPDLDHRHFYDFYPLTAIIDAAGALNATALVNPSPSNAVRIRDGLIAIRARLAERSFLLERMMQVALTDSLLSAANRSLFASAQRRDRGRFLALREAVAPLTRREASMTATWRWELDYARDTIPRIELEFDGEALYQKHRREYDEAVAIRPDLDSEPPDRDKYEDQEKPADWPPTEQDSYIELAGLMAEISQLDFSESAQLEQLAQQVRSITEAMAALDAGSANALAKYEQLNRFMALHFLAVRALADIYESGISGAEPNIAAPEGWHWGWRDNDRELCLEPYESLRQIFEFDAVCAQNLLVIEMPEIKP